MKTFAAENLKNTLNTLLVDAAKSGPDGLAVIAADTAPPNNNMVVVVPPRLHDWLRDLRLLRHVPLAYLVPDPALLPPESIRFFHVDRTWCDRLVEGAMSAGNIGTLDMTFTAATLTDLRRLLDDELGSGPMTGMLIRSELVERWPDLIVETKPASVVLRRQDLLSRSIMIVLFSGTPTEVHLREPDVGMRFGVEWDDQDKRYEVNLHDTNGNLAGAAIEIKLFTRRVLDVAGLKTHLKPGLPGDPTRSRDIAINLRQAPYVAMFKNTVDPAHGSEVAGKTHKVKVRGRDVSVLTLLGTRGRALQGDD